ncbi:MAG: ribbon-helix-helix domain-containing protein [Sulfolobales archaeon]
MTESVVTRLVHTSFAVSRSVVEAVRESRMYNILAEAVRDAIRLLARDGPVSPVGRDGEEVVIVSAFVPPSLLKVLDELVERGFYRSRSSAVEAALWALVERRRRRGRAGKRSKAVEERLVAVQEYLEKNRVATVGQLARALELSHAQALYAVRLLNVCYKVVGRYAFVGRTCADVEEHLRSEYAKMAETVRRLVDGCRSAVCCARLSVVVSVLTRRDPPRAADMAFYMALLEEFPGELSARRVAVNKVAVCTRRT